MSNQNDSSASEFTFTGALLVGKPMTRVLNYYAVTKVELEQISSWNQSATVCFSGATLGLAALIGFIWDLIISGPISSKAKGIAWLMVIIAVVWMLGLIAGGVFFSCKRTSTVSGILRDAGEHESVLGENDKSSDS